MNGGIRWILFDAVGTLIYADPPVADVYCATGREFGSRLSAAEIQQRFVCAAARRSERVASLVRPPTSEAAERERWRRIVAAVIDDVDSSDELFEQLWQHFAEPQHWQLYDDVRQHSERLRSHGFRLGIASNFDSRLGPIVAAHPVLAACEAVFVSSAIGYAKPDPRFFAAVQQRLGVSPAEIVLVGDDDVNDIQGRRRGLAGGVSGRGSAILKGAHFRRSRVKAGSLPYEARLVNEVISCHDAARMTQQRSRWLVPYITAVVAWVIRLWMSTMRVRIVSADGREHPADPATEGTSTPSGTKGCSAPLAKRPKVRVLISQHTDGEVIAQICQHLGMGVIRGSTARGGCQALLSMIRDVDETTHLGITPDGPRGPRRELKPGVVMVASQSGLPVVPIGIGFVRAWRFRSWDRFALPLPGSTIVGVIGAPLVDSARSRSRRAETLDPRSWKARCDC